MSQNGTGQNNYLIFKRLSTIRYKGRDKFSDLVEATNVSRGNMFHHFKNKEDIFHHAVDSFEFTIDQEM